MADLNFASLPNEAARIADLMTEVMVRINNESIPMLERQRLNIATNAFGRVPRPLFMGNSSYVKYSTRVDIFYVA